MWSTLMQDFEALLEKIDQGLRALPATAQVCRLLMKAPQGCCGN